ncbi:MAG TPA: hypothetical protein VM891_05275 [Amaricoccus sp.]|nr:hypothetical protein [Amaricoccus sp.]
MDCGDSRRVCDHVHLYSQGPDRRARAHDPHRPARPRAARGDGPLAARPRRALGRVRAFEAMAARARALSKPVVVLKAGRSDAARAAAFSHTASLAGAGAVASAFLARLGLVEVASPAPRSAARAARRA